MADNKPRHEFKIGRVKVTIWENHGEEGNWFTVTFLRLYKQDEKWKTTPRFKRDDLLSLADAAARATEWMDGQEERKVGHAAAGLEEEERLGGQ
jgi:hypothetical protein